ncbi:MAG: FHA domain-containing protein [Pirellulales bacterium]
MNDMLADRFQLWVDSVGGYLVCRGEKITIGQAIPAAGVDVPIMGDISRRHLSIRREGESYLLFPRGETLLDGRTAGAADYLRDGALIELTGGVKLRFRKPHPLSATARIDFESRHRTQPRCDAVLLMADAAVLGPKTNAHIACRGWPAEVVLFAAREGLRVRCDRSMTIDGTVRRSPAALRHNSQVVGEGFSFSLEPVTES